MLLQEPIELIVQGNGIEQPDGSTLQLQFAAEVCLALHLVMLLIDAASVQWRSVIPRRERKTQETPGCKRAL